MVPSSSRVLDDHPSMGQVNGLHICHMSARRFQSFSSSSQSYAIERGCLSVFMGSFGHVHTFPPFILIKIFSQVKTSSGVRMILVDSCWPQQEWYSSLLTRLVDELLKVSALLGSLSAV